MADFPMDTRSDGMIVSVDEMKNYLRVDAEEENELIEAWIRQAEQLCMDVTRISDANSFEVEPVAKIAVMYAVAYLYEHREESNHQELVLGLRALLFGIRREEF
ncbi:putative DNA packaging protein [Lachnospiraceae bacterium TWA4]|nr:putative DNA packaging protein [Lachnospiraceae bacterium TWA4]